MRVHNIPLAEHAYSFMSSAVGTYIMSKAPEESLNFLVYILKNQEKYKVKDVLSFDQAQEMLAKDAAYATKNKVA